MQSIIIISLFLIFACTSDEKPDTLPQEETVQHSLDRDSVIQKKEFVAAKIHSDAPKGIFKENPPSSFVSATIHTNIGSMTFELYPARAPLATENFINLVRRGFYDGNEFFRLIPDFIVQTGDKTNTGYADAGYQFKTEHHPDLSHDRKGILSYANHDSSSNSSQFFITLSAQTQLDERHPIFGMMIQGREVLEKINEIETDDNDRPLKKIIIKSISIDGY